MIKANGIVKSYGQVQVLNNVSFEALKGELVAITGKSGAGKSTLLHILGTLETPDQGNLSINGKDPGKLSENSRADLRNNSLGFIFQFHHLLPEFNALENVCIPAYIAKQNQNKTEKRARELLVRLGLGHRLSHKPKELSGGEQQRIAFARALVNQPDIILADEPTGNLDEKTADELHSLILEFNKEFNITFVIVTHNLNLAALCHRHLEMNAGRFV